MDHKNNGTLEKVSDSSWSSIPHSKHDLIDEDFSTSTNSRLILTQSINAEESRLREVDGEPAIKQEPDPIDSAFIESTDTSQNTIDVEEGTMRELDGLNKLEPNVKQEPDTTEMSQNTIDAEHIVTLMELDELVNLQVDVKEEPTVEDSSLNDSIEVTQNDDSQSITKTLRNRTINTDEKLYHCTSCKFVFGVASSFEDHNKCCPSLDTSTTSLSSASRKGKKSGKKVASKRISFHMVCCEEVFPNMKLFNIHKFLKHQLEMLVCGLCNIEVEQPRHLYNHYMDIHFNGLTLEFTYNLRHGEGTKSIAKQNKLKPKVEENSSNSTGTHNERECTALQEGILCQCSTCCKEDQKINYTIRNPIKCGLCNFRFPFMKSLNKHMKNHQGLKSFPCHICARSFTSARSLVYHNTAFHSIEPRITFSCNICFKQLSCKNSLKRHLSIHTYQGKSISRVSCPHCAKTFSGAKTLGKHIKVHTIDSDYICDHCNKHYRNKDMLAVHITIKHLPHEPIKCESCDYVAPNKIYLSAHRNKKHSSNIFGCEICGKIFKTKINLYNHMPSHFEDRPFVCPTCGKTFKRDVNLLQHMGSHSSKRPHACDVCGLTFRLRTHVKQHMAVHGVGDNHKCVICSKSFARKTALNIHMEGHLPKLESSFK